MSNFSHEYIILDACCVINLYASGYMRSILESIPKRIAIAAYVLNEEAKRLCNSSAEQTVSQPEMIDLQSLIEEKFISIASLENEAEEIMVINFSSTVRVDTGEAITAAIAVARQWSLGTDDKHAISFFTRHVPQLHLVSTLDIVKHWADATHPQLPLSVIGMALDNIQNRARYKPHPTHPLFKWWESVYLQKES